MEGYLALILHAHLPYVRHQEHEDFLEENWLFEAITETYIPLFLIIERLLEEGVEFRLTVSLTPSLASMLQDPLLQARYLRKLDKTVELTEKEIDRTRHLPEFHPLALMYHRVLLDVREAFVNRYSKDLVSGFQRFQESGKVEVIASAATHGYLPLLSVNESAVRAQIGVGVRHYEQIFGRSPRGFWLPECGYYPGVDRLLAERGIEYTILETHGLTRADHRPRYGVYAPLVCPSGLAVFGRDPDCSRQVWSSAVGYPGDFDYREFYRDIGHDLDLEYVRPYIHPDGIRTDTGIKYYRITGKDHKEPYVPEWAEQKAARHAEHFLSERIKQVQEVSPGMDRPPVIVAPYDAELFGHWWFEGPRWLDYLIRKIAFDQQTIRLVTLSEYLDRCPDNQVATPSASSWGRNGHNEVWLNGENDWIYRHIHAGADVMEELAASHPQPSGLLGRALDQAGRELLLAEASDWTFMINSGDMQAYATAGIKSHLLRLHRLREQIAAGQIDEVGLESVEEQDNIFASIPVAEEFSRRDTAERRQPIRPVRVTLPERLKIVMACPELVPFAKTGGLADMTPSLAKALVDLGHQVSVVMPAYRSVLHSGVDLRHTGLRLSVPVGGVRENAGVLTATTGSGIPVYFIEAARYFDRPALYGTVEGDYPDNARRFAFFARAVLELLRQIGAPHILHAHDWQSALSIAFLKAQPERYPGLSTVRTALTVHNLGYQGAFGEQEWPVLNLDRNLFTPRHFEFYGKINFLKAGLAFADTITTVSPTYACEIQMPEYGFGLEGVLRERAAHLTGILNGVDYDMWNPETDRWINHTYGVEDLSGKGDCKADLQAQFGLPVESGVPLIGMVTRLASQKGMDLLEAAIDELMKRDLQLVIGGMGDQKYQALVGTWARQYPGRVAVKIAFDEGLAHQIEAGADMFLMPSRYEPSGLNQLYSLKYGTIPIVRATGGLKDSVEDFDGQAGTGFLFDAYEPSALLAAVDRALHAYQEKELWRALMRNAMSADFSWKRSAEAYIRVFRGDAID